MALATEDYRMNRIKFLSCAALLLSGAQFASGQAFSRSDDMRVKPPQAFEGSRNKLNLEGGFNYLEGNVDSLGVNGAFDYKLEINPKSEFIAEGAANYASFGHKTQMEKLRGSLLYAWHLAPNWNIFVTNSQAHNRFLALHYRTATGAGLCFHNFMPKTAFDTFLISAAVTPEYADFENGVIERYVRGVGRITFSVKPSGYFEAGFDGLYLPALSDFPNYRLYGEVYAKFTVVPDRLSYKITASDEYDSRPQPGIKFNDFTFTQALVVHIGS